MGHGTDRARLAAALRALNAEVMLAEDFDPSELGIAPPKRGFHSAATGSCGRACCRAGCGEARTGHRLAR